jgi:hypothetical protein
VASTHFKRRPAVASVGLAINAGVAVRLVFNFEESAESSISHGTILA